MKNRIYNFFIIILLFSLHTFLYAETNYVNKQGTTVETRDNVPAGYKRVSVEKGSFAEFLRNQKLKPYGEKALYYNGKEQYREEKAKENADSKERIHYYLRCY